MVNYLTYSIRRQTGRHDSPDSYLPPADMRNSLEMFTANSDSSDILETVESRVKESVLSNGSKFKETAMVIESKTYRIQCDNSPDKVSPFGLFFYFGALKCSVALQRFAGWLREYCNCLS